MSTVGPILHADPTGRAVAEAIRQANPGATVLERGAYLRVKAPSPCTVTAEAIGVLLGRAFHLPGALEAVMPSFSGRLRFEGDRVVWERGD